MGGDCVLNGQLVQVEFVRDRPDLFEIRSVQPDPGHAAPFPQDFVGLIEGPWIGAASPTDVHRVVDHSHGDLC
jgi:hypothetical protein